MVRLTLVSLSALLAASLASPSFAAGAGMGAKEKPAAHQMSAMGPHHHARHRHYYHRYAGDRTTRQLNRQEYASHMGPAAPPPQSQGFQPFGTNAFQQGYRTPPLSTPAVNTGR